MEEVNFPKTGGTKTYRYGMENCILGHSITFRSSENWISYGILDNEYITITARENTTGQERNGTIVAVLDNNPCNFEGEEKGFLITQDSV